MAALTGLYISSSYGGVIHLSTNTSITTGSATQLQDGFGTNLGVWLNGQGNVSASTFTGLASSATSASYAVNSTSASYAVVATNGFPYTGSAKISGSLGITGSLSITNGVEVKAGDLDFSGGNINIYSGNINQIAGASTLQTTVISGSLTLKQGATGSLLGTASFAISASYSNNATSASYASLAANSILLNGTASSVFATTGSNIFKGNQTISGSVINEVKAAAGNSSTASLDLSIGNFFTLTLVNGVTTHISASNIQRGQTVQLQVTQPAGVGGVTFTNNFTFPSGSNYVAFATASAVDVVSFISFDGTKLRAVAQNNFI